MVIPDSVTSIGSSAFSRCSSLTSITIPDSVTSIGYAAFSSCSSLESINVDADNTVYHSTDNCLIKTATNILITGCKNSIIPADGSVTNIGNSAFWGCSSLTSVTIPDSVTSIGSSAFGDCSKLTSVTIGDGVTSIGDYAFYYCSSLTSIDIPNSVTSIGYDAFSDCSSLTSVNITDIAKWCGIEFSSTYSNPLYYAQELYLNSELVTDLIIPDSVTSIGSYAFRYCSSLTSVTIPDSVTSIGSSAFGNCSSLTSITIPDSVTSIGNKAFISCIALTEISIPNSVTTIGNYAFSGCSGLTSITIPDSVTSIGNNAFTSCIALTEISIPNSVITIDSYTFQGCSSLSSITIPDSVKAIGNSAFAFCIALTEISIPNSVTNIGNSAFRGCSSLTSVIVPDSVTSIGDAAFSGCSNLTLAVKLGSYAQTYAIQNNIRYVLNSDMCTHNKAEIKNSINVTCTSDGYTGDIYCTDCGELISSGSAIAAKGHSYIETIVDPTYTEQGYKTTACEICGYVQLKEYLSYAICDINKDGYVNEDDLNIYSSGLMPDDFDAAVLDFDSDGEQSAFDTQIFTRLANGIDMDAMADANGDGVTTLADMLRIKKMLADSAVSGNADFNSTGDVDADDLAFAKRFLLMVR